MLGSRYKIQRLNIINNRLLEISIFYWLEVLYISRSLTIEYKVIKSEIILTKMVRCQNKCHKEKLFNVNTREKNVKMKPLTGGNELGDA